MTELRELTEDERRDWAAGKDYLGPDMVPSTLVVYAGRHVGYRINTRGLA